MTPKEIAQRLTDNCEAVAKHLLPKGKREASEWRVGSVHGEEGQSLGIHLSGTKAGVWSDFASGEAGDLLDLWAAVRNLPLAEAINEAKHYLGIRDEYQFSGHTPKNFDRPRKPKCRIPNSAVLQYLTKDRGLTPETLKAFQIGEKGREIVFPFLRDGELVMCKTMGIDRDENGKKINPPKPTSVNQEPCLFGWQAIPDNARRVVITEGEIDACSWYQLGHPALSVPYGGGKGGKQQWIENEYDRLQRFDEILVAMDSDQPGQDAAQEIIERLGRHRCRLVSGLNVKDINEALVECGITPEMADAVIRDAKTMDPVELRNAADYVDETIAEFYPEEGAATCTIYPPWFSADGKLAFREAELTILNGINGHGKSQLAGHLMLEAMRQDHRVCIASMEMSPKRLLGKLTKQAGAIINNIPSISYIHAIHQWYSDKLWVFDLVGTAKTERLLEVFIYARQRYDIQLFVIDSLLKCGIREDDYNGQKRFVEQLCDFKNEYGCHVILVTHSRKGDSENKPTGKMDVKGTGSITDMADTVLTTWRDKKKERAIANACEVNADIPKEVIGKPDAKLFCDKQRNGTWEGIIPLWFCRSSNQFLGYQNAKPYQYVNYSQQESGRGEDSHG